jgi:hypothetical protein
MVIRPVSLSVGKRLTTSLLLGAGRSSGGTRDEQSGCNDAFIPIAAAARGLHSGRDIRLERCWDKMIGNSEDIKRATDGVDVWNKWADDQIAKGEKRVANFSGHEFGAISFERFRFPGPVYFSRAVFNEATSFRTAKFHDDANFNDAKFKASACFDHARFHEFANFSSAKFEKEFHVSGATFSSEVNFEGASFNHAEFTGVQFEYFLTRFTDAKFKHVPDFRAASFEAPPLFQRVDIKYTLAPGVSGWQRWMSRAAGADDAVRFRLKELAAEWRDHERELTCFANELRAKRFHETKDFGGIVINWAYDVLSNFGRSIGRPVFGLLLLTCLAWVVIMATYSTICGATWEQMKAGAVSGPTMKRSAAMTVPLESVRGRGLIRSRSSDAASAPIDPIRR